MAETYYRILKENIKDEEDIIINRKGDRILTSSIEEVDFKEPTVVIFSKHWYRVPVLKK